LPDKPHVNYLIVKCLVKLEEPRETNDPIDFDEAMDTDDISDSIMEVDSILDSQEDEEFAQSVSLQMSEHFHTIRHSGISVRIESLIDRFHENAANFGPLVYGMLRVIHWTAELANYFNFETPHQAVIATELFLSTWDDCSQSLNHLEYLAERSTMTHGRKDSIWIWPNLKNTTNMSKLPLVMLCSTETMKSEVLDQACYYFFYC